MQNPQEQPFRSKAEREQEKALEAQYRTLGSKHLQAAAQQHQQSDERQPQQG